MDGFPARIVLRRSEFVPTAGEPPQTSQMGQLACEGLYGRLAVAMMEARRRTNSIGLVVLQASLTIELVRGAEGRRSR